MCVCIHTCIYTYMYRVCSLYFINMHLHTSLVLCICDIYDIHMHICKHVDRYEFV